MHQTTEKEPDDGSKSSSSILTGSLPLQSETCFFILMSALDVFATYMLLAGGNHVESNPIANFFFQHWNMPGMIAYKFTMVAFVCVITQIIARYKLSTARWLLIFLSVIVGAVVVYSLFLLTKSWGMI